MFADVINTLNEWMRYALTYDSETALHDFDELQGIYNNIKFDWKPTAENKEYCKIFYEIVFGAFEQYKICMENIETEECDERIDIIFENLKYTINKLDFELSDDEEMDGDWDNLSQQKTEFESSDSESDHFFSDSSRDSVKQHSPILAGSNREFGNINWTLVNN